MASKGLLLNAKKKTPLKVKKRPDQFDSVDCFSNFQICLVWNGLLNIRLSATEQLWGFRHFDFYAYAYARFKDHSSLNPQTVKQI